MPSEEAIKDIEYKRVSFHTEINKWNFSSHAVQFWTLITSKNFNILYPKGLTTSNQRASSGPPFQITDTEEKRIRPIGYILLAYQLASTTLDSNQKGMSYYGDCH